MSLLARLIGRMPAPILKRVSRLRWRHPVLRRALNWFTDRLRRQDGRISQGVGAGLQFNIGGTKAGFLLGTSELPVQAVLAALLKPGMVFYDVGANVGFFSVIGARLVGPTGRVVSFEPLPSNAEGLVHNARLNGFGWITVRTEALGDSNGPGQFEVSDEPTWGRLRVDGQPVGLKKGEVSVQVRCLDSLMAEAHLPEPDVVKIDVEGAETEVLAGASALLRAGSRCPLLMIELHGTNAGVATALTDYHYHAVVLGGGAVTEARWDAFVLAAPREKPDLVSLIDDLARNLPATTLVPRSSE